MAPTCRDFCLLLLPFALLHVLLRPSPASSPLMPGAACAHESRWFEDVLFSLWALALGSGDNHAQNTLLYSLIDALDATGMSMNNYGFAPAPRELGVERYQLQMYAEVSGALGGWLERTARANRSLHIGDVGCGLGGGTAWLQRRHPAHRFTGIDRAPAKAKWVSARRSGACTVHADFFEDELPGAAFDGLLFVESLHLRVGAERGDGGFSELADLIYDRLRGDGQLVIADRFQSKAELDALVAALGAAFEVRAVREITPHVVEAGELDVGRRRNITRQIPVVARVAAEALTPWHPGVDWPPDAVLRFVPSGRPYAMIVARLRNGTARHRDTRPEAYHPSVRRAFPEVAKRAVVPNLMSGAAAAASAVSTLRPRGETAVRAAGDVWRGGGASARLRLCADGRLVPSLYLAGFAKAGTSLVADILHIGVPALAFAARDGGRGSVDSVPKSIKEPKTLYRPWPTSRDLGAKYPDCADGRFAFAIDGSPGLAPLPHSVSHLQRLYGAASPALRFIFVTSDDPAAEIEAEWRHMLSDLIRVNKDDVPRWQSLTSGDLGGRVKQATDSIMWVDLYQEALGLADRPMSEWSLEELIDRQLRAAHKCLRDGVPYAELHPRCGTSGLFARLYGGIVAHVAALFGECRVAVVDLPQVLRGAPAAVDALGGWLGAAPLNASVADRVAAHAAHYSTPSWRGGDHGGTHGEFLSAPALARLREFYARDQATLKAIKKARRGGVPRACTEVDRLIEM